MDVIKQLHAGCCLGAFGFNWIENAPPLTPVPYKCFINCTAAIGATSKNNPIATGNSYDNTELTTAGDSGQFKVELTTAGGTTVQLKDLEDYIGQMELSNGFSTQFKVRVLITHQFC